MRSLPELAQRTLDRGDLVEPVADRFWQNEFFLYLGRYIGLPVALEGALKLKEISYIPTDAYAAGEMKHGPIALLDDSTPVVVVATDNHVYEKVMSNVQEVRARGAHVIAVATEGNVEIEDVAEHVFLPAADGAGAAGGAGDPAAAAARLRHRPAPRPRHRQAAQPRQDRHGRVGARGLGGCSTTSASPSRTSPRPSASTAPSSPCWASSPATRTPSSSSGRTGTSGPTDREHPVTRGLHVGFRAPTRAAVDAFWQAGIDAGYRDDGAPGPRTVYGPDYYGGFLLDPDGNSAEAVHDERERPVPDGRIDHLWIRVRDLAASKRFYTTIAPHAGIRLGVRRARTACSSPARTSASR